MKFLYEYRTPDNAKHNGVICASDREAAYAALKKQGVKPCRFSEAPGFFNKLFGKGKRWLAIGVLCVVCLVLCLVVAKTSNQAQGVKDVASGPAALPRHQIPNLPVDWTQYVDSIFSNDVDRILARHSQPGVAAGATAGRVPPKAAWVASLRGIVEGMRAEANGFMKLGRSVEELERFLDERQRMEADYRKRTIEQIRLGEIGKNEANETLRAMELLPVE